MATTTATRFAAIDTTGTSNHVVYGIGSTEDAALADAAEYGADASSLRAVPCTSALYERVESDGGDIAWDLYDGVADVYREPAA